MSVYEDKAKLLAVKVTGVDQVENSGVSLDPAMIALGLALLKEIIALYRSCHRPATMAAANMQKPGVIARRRLRRLIEARQLPEGVSVKQMHTAALEIGQTCTVEEVTEMYAAA